jgi:hypothetical protein
MKTEGYDFLITQRSSISPGGLTDVVGLRYNEVTVPISNVDVLVDDVIHLKYYESNIPKGVYGVCTSVDMDGVNPNFVFKFDQDVYELFNNILQQDVIGIDNYRGTVYDKVSQYDITASVNRATYGDELKSYYTSLDYNLIINQENRLFFNGFKQVITADKILFADYCKSFAYGVSLSEDSYNNINNVFKQSVNFNIAKR